LDLHSAAELRLEGKSVDEVLRVFEHPEMEERAAAEEALAQSRAQREESVEMPADVPADFHKPVVEDLLGLNDPPEPAPVATSAPTIAVGGYPTDSPPRGPSAAPASPSGLPAVPLGPAPDKQTQEEYDLALAKFLQEQEYENGGVALPEPVRQPAPQPVSGQPAPDTSLDEQLARQLAEEEERAAGRGAQPTGHDQRGAARQSGLPVARRAAPAARSMGQSESLLIGGSAPNPTLETGPSASLSLTGLLKKTRKKGGGKYRQVTAGGSQSLLGESDDDDDDIQLGVDDEWEVVRRNDGTPPYWFNKRTRMTQWEPPAHIQRR